MDLPDSVERELDKRGGVNGLLESIPESDSLDGAIKTLRALSDPNRLKILRLLEVQPLCPCLLARAVRISDSKLSYHLSMLREADLIEGFQDGRWIIYALTERGSSILVLIDELK